MQQLAYGVTLMGGNRSSFIATLLVNMHYSGHRHMLHVDEFGSSHTFITTYVKELTNCLDLSNSDGVWELNNVYNDKIVGINDSIPVISFTPSIIDYDKIFEIKKNFKHIRIRYTEKDCLHIAANHFYKMWRQHYPQDMTGWVKLMYDESPGIRRGISDVREFTFKEFVELQKHPASESSNYAAKICENKKYLTFTAPYIYDIYFSDIVNNKRRVVETLEACTGRRLSDHLHKYYDKYVKQQHRFFDPLFNGEIDYPK